MEGKNPRLCCLKALQRWEIGREFADEVLHQALQRSGLNNVNRSFVTETFYGVIRNRSYLDFIIQRFRSSGLDMPTRQVLRLGVYQLYKMRIPDHAAVYETVNIAGAARTLVNAVLRKTIAEKDHILRQLQDAPVHIRYSHPEFLWHKWESRHGGKLAEELCAWNNEPAKIYVRANRLRVTPGELIESFPGAKLLDVHPDCLEVHRLPLSWISSGVAYVQDPSTLVACDLLDPKPGEVVLDACAAPGGKAGYMAQKMENQGTLVACDYDKLRLARLEQNLLRLGVSNTKIVLLDWLEHASAPFNPDTFDAILVDVPCTNTGVIRRRTDVKWRLSPQDFPRMQHLQARIVKATIQLLKSGGRLVYSTCSIEPEENERVVDYIDREVPELRFSQARSSMPIHDHLDGAFAALFVKA
ncbi:MAG: 16S rRNA (cytosine(967)-C(5))-methyltransferase RsmB [Verrucomicrobia bacterium]|nr:16S rRNA (cytosine(967)-C(5))-methyltransferase RsmB [Verrucomicrobiota bacterium]